MDLDPPSPPVPDLPGGLVLRRVLAWFRPHLGALARAGLLLLVSVGLFQAGPLLLRIAVDEVLPAKDPDRLLRVVACYAAVQALMVAVHCRLRLRLETVGLDVVAEVRRRAFAHAMGLSLEFHDRTPVGALIARIDGDAESMRQLFTFAVLVVVGDVLKVAAALVVMASLHAGLAALMAVVLAAIAVFSMYVQRVGRELFRTGRERNAGVMAFLQERLQAVGVIQVYGREDHQAGAQEARSRAKFEADWRGSLLWNGFYNLLVLVEQVGICVCLWWGGQDVLAGSVSLGTLVLFCEYIRALFMPVARLSEQISALQRAWVGATRVVDLLEARPVVVDPPEPVRVAPVPEVLEFEDVSFSYRRDGSEPVVQGVSFRIPRGEVQALVGPTGGGKSTLVHLLLRFYDPTSGRVLRDGVDLRRIALFDLRRPMALVLQDPQIFPGTVADNIRMGWPGLDDAAVREAARRVGADEFISRLPQGYATRLAERGVDLSTGERQLIAFARALARDPAVLVLDEATASVDPETERRIQASLAGLLAGRTALVVAHRLSTVESAHRILVVEGGRIAEAGNHRDLIGRKGAYARLHAALGAAS